MIRSAPPTDDTLVHRAQRGDRGAMVQLYQRYVSEIYGYAYNQLGSVQDAEDVTSETFLRVVGALGGYRGQSSFRTWLYAIAHNQVRDHWRRNGHQPATVELDQARAAIEDLGYATDARASANGHVLATAAPVGLDAESTADDDERIGAISRGTELGGAVLAELPERYRTILRYRIMDGRSIRDTADELGLSESNVKVLQHRALRRAAEIARGLDPGGSRDPDGLDEDGHDAA